jgi:hypothetical protein
MRVHHGLHGYGGGKMMGCGDRTCIPHLANLSSSQIRELEESSSLPLRVVVMQMRGEERQRDARSRG